MCCYFECPLFQRSGKNGTLNFSSGVVKPKNQNSRKSSSTSLNGKTGDILVHVEDG